MDALKIIANLRWAHFSSRYLIPVYATLTVYDSLILSHAIREKTTTDPNSCLTLESIMLMSAT